MPFAVSQSLESQVTQIQSILGLNDGLRQKAAGGEVQPGISIDDHYWRRYDYCAAVLRIYASFERFVIEAVQKWVEWVVANDFSILSSSDKAIERYQFGVGEILRRSTENRFSKVNLVTLVNGLSALQNGSVAALGTDALFATTPNLRLLEVLQVLEAVEILGAQSWIEAYPPLAEFCDTANTTPESFLKDLVERRNEAAHGNKLPDDFLAVNLLQDAAKFVSVLADGIAELIVSKMLVAATSGAHGAKAVIGTVTETFPRHKAVVIRANGNGVWTGMNLLVLTKKRCYIDTVQSIQINGIDTAAWLSRDAEEIGFKLKLNVAKGAKLYSTDALPTLGTLMPSPRMV